MQNEKMAPFVKWAGGKTQLLDAIMALKPKNYNNYHEPFVGGGAVLFKEQPSSGTINDLNDELMATYRTIKDNCTELLKILRNLVDTHNSADNPHDFYYKIRDLEVVSDIDKAVRFIYLNKTGFNGLYRVNNSGKFNVPYGKKDTLKYTTVFSETNLKRISHYLNTKDIKLYNTDFSYLLDVAKSGDFVFIDSPYDQSFVDYTKEGFNQDEHKRLAYFVHQLHERGIKFMLTNHNTELIKELYKNFQIYELPVNRSINSNGSNRSNATTEVIIVNYPISKEQERNFEISKFFKQLKPTSYVLQNYVNWDKINQRLNDKGLKLNDLNYLFSSTIEEFNSQFEVLYKNRPESFSILPLLISSRSTDFVYLDSDADVNKFDFTNKLSVQNFLIDSGLRDNLFINSQKNRNMREYYLGLEVGITSADKKNLSGKWASEQIAKLLSEKSIPFTKEVPYNKVLNITLERDKYFDYVFTVNDITYCLEINFFNTSGSKINSESARFEDLSRTFENYKGLEFVWVTDGIGLKKHQTQIQKALSKIDNMFNFTTFQTFLDELMN